LKNSVLLVSQFGIFFMGLFGGFLTQIAPPEEEAEFWPGLVTLISCGIFLLVWLKSRFVEQSQRERRFYRLALLTLPLSIALLACYHGLFEVRTANYTTGRKIIGSVLTDRGQQYKELHEATNEDLLRSNAGNPQGVWTEWSITESRMLLGSSYALAIGLFALGLIGGCQGLKDPGRSKNEDVSQLDSPPL
jgi:hypothetical protein